MRKRIVSIWMCLALAGGLLYGCGNLEVSSGVTVDDKRTQSFFFVGDSDVPYISLSDWAVLMTDIKNNYLSNNKDVPFELSYSKEGDTGILTREGGVYTASFDCAADTITFFDYDAFIRDDDSKTIIDLLSDEHPEYFRRSEGSYEKYGQKLVLRLGDYGIDNSKNTLYILSTLSL